MGDTINNAIEPKGFLREVPLFFRSMAMATIEYKRTLDSVDPYMAEYEFEGSVIANRVTPQDVISDFHDNVLENLDCVLFFWSHLLKNKRTLPLIVEKYGDVLFFDHPDTVPNENQNCENNGNIISLDFKTTAQIERWKIDLSDYQDSSAIIDLIGQKLSEGYSTLEYLRKFMDDKTLHNRQLNAKDDFRMSFLGGGESDIWDAYSRIEFLYHKDTATRLGLFPTAPDVEQWLHNQPTQPRNISNRFAWAP